MSRQRAAASRPGQPDSTLASSVLAVRQRRRGVCHLHAAQAVEHHRPVAAVDVVDGSLKQADAGAEADGGLRQVIQGGGGHIADSQPRRKTEDRRRKQARVYRGGEERMSRGGVQKRADSCSPASRDFFGPASRPSEEVMPSCRRSSKSQQSKSPAMMDVQSMLERRDDARHRVLAQTQLWQVGMAAAGRMRVPRARAPNLR